MEVTVIDSLVNNCVDDLPCRVISGQVIDVMLTENIYVDAVYHLASTVGPVGVLGQSGQMASGIVNDTVILRDYCVDRGTKFNFVSTSEIYGDVRNWNEDSVKVFPAEYTVRSEYAVGKMASEISIVNKAKVSDLKYTIIRPFNVAGPSQKPDFGFVSQSRSLSQISLTSVKALICKPSP